MNCFCQDRFYLLAVLAGPMVWLGLYLSGMPINTEFRLGVLHYVAVIVIYPFFEELLFRGILQPILQENKVLVKKFYFVTWANIITSAVFCFFHLLNHPLFWAISVFFPSLVFGWSMDRYKTLAAPLFLHGFYNAGYFLLFA